MTNSGTYIICRICNNGTYEYVAPDYINLKKPYYKCRTCGEIRGELETVDE